MNWKKPPPRSETYGFPEGKDATVPITMAANKPPREYSDVRTRDKEGSLSGREKEKKE